MMRIYYEVKEYLTVKDRLMEEELTVKDQVIAVMDYQLSALGARLLRQQASIHQLVLTADGLRQSFSGNTVTAGLGTLMTAMRDARNVELTLHYGFYAQTMNGMGPVAGPRSMLCFLEELTTEEMDGIFYSAWFQSDGDAGVLFAYGNLDGTFHHGKIAANAVSLPSAGQ